jgi:hypothetical protein
MMGLTGDPRFPLLRARIRRHLASMLSRILLRREAPMVTSGPHATDAGGQPDVSIIMSTFNEKRWLPETIAAVLGQSHANLEFIIIDDASTDGSEALLAGYSDPRLRVIRHDARNGWLDNINKMALLARGRLLKLLCPDDVMKPDCVAAAVNLYDTHPEIGFLFCDFDFVSEDGRILDTRVPANYPRIIPREDADRLALFDGCFANTSCLFVPRDKWLQMGGMRDLPKSNPAKWPTVEDFDIMVRLQEFYPVGYIPGQLVNVRAHPQQVQGNPIAKPLITEANMIVIQNLLDRITRSRPENARQTRYQILVRVAQHHLNPGIKLLLRGEWRTGCAVLARVGEIFPLRELVVPWVTRVAAPALRRRTERLLGGAR